MFRVPLTRLARALVPTLLLAAGLAGCQAPPAPPEAARAPVLTPEHYHRVLHAARRVLLERGHALDREDPRYGVLTTRPRPVATVLEPWEAGRPGARGLAATLNAQRYIVRIRIEPLPAKHRWTLGTEVLLEQQHQSTVHLSGSTDGRRLHRFYAAVPAELEARGIGARFWRPLRRERDLERAILAEVLEAAELEPSPPLHTDSKPRNAS